MGEKSGSKNKVCITCWKIRANVFNLLKKRDYLSCCFLTGFTDNKAFD